MQSHAPRTVLAAFVGLVQVECFYLPASRNHPDGSPPEVDVPDSVIRDATNGSLDSCHAGMQMGFCGEAFVFDHACPQTCKAAALSKGQTVVDSESDQTHMIGKFNPYGVPCCQPGHCDKCHCQCPWPSCSTCCGAQPCPFPPPPPSPPPPPPSPPPPSPPPPPPMPPMRCYEAEIGDAADEASLTGYCWVRLAKACSRGGAPGGVWFADSSYGGDLGNDATYATCSARGWDHYCGTNAEYRIADQFGTPVGQLGCETPPGLCHYPQEGVSIAEYVYDETVFDGKHWDGRCGDLFWASQGGPAAPAPPPFFPAPPALSLPPSFPPLEDCTMLPSSPNGNAFPRGCAGAVWSNGSPSSTYCAGDGGKMLWFAACCEWSGTACVAHSGRVPLPPGETSNALAGPLSWLRLEEQVVECNGAICREAASAVNAGGTCSTKCVPTSSPYGGNGCKFTLSRYAAQLVHMAQRRAHSVLVGSGDVFAQAAELRYVIATLTSFAAALEAQGEQPDDAHGGLALVRAHIAAIQTMTNTVGHVSRVGYVPAFTRDFYANQLTTYMKTFEGLMDSLQRSISESKLLKAFLAQLDNDAAILNGKSSITAVSKKQTIATLYTSLNSMQTAQQGLHDVGGRMVGAAYAFKQALDKWMQDQMVQMVTGLCMSMASFAISGIGSISAAAGKWSREIEKTGKQTTNFFNRKSTYYVMNFVNDFREAMTEIGQVSASINKLENKLPPVVQNMSKSIAAIVTKMGLPGVPDGQDPTEALTKSARKLQALLPTLGTGAWAEYVASGRKVFNPFLEGYNGAVHGAAQTYIDHLQSQAAYGDDFMAAGIRYIAAVQQFLILEAQSNASATAREAISNVYKVTDDLAEYDMFQQGVLTVQMTTLALQMRIVVQQLCQSYNYQATRLYKQCVRGPSMTGSASNPVNDLCGAFEEDAAGFEPFYRSPCEPSDKLSEAANAYMGSMSRFYSNAILVNEHITNQVWGTDSSALDSPFITVRLTPFEDHACDHRTLPRMVDYWSLCNSSLAEQPPNITFHGEDCLLPNSTKLPDGWVCCRIIRWESGGCTPSDTPQDRPTVSASQFKAFKDNRTEAWGKLTFAITPSMASMFSSYDELFVSGISAYLEGARLDRFFANVNVRISPTGGMLNRVKNHSWVDDPSCRADVKANSESQCMFNNYTFHGSPTRNNSVSYTMYYSDPINASASPPTCSDSTIISKPVFDSPPRRTLACNNNGPCFYYCTNLDFISLEAGMVAKLHDSKSPFNLASIYTTYELQVYNRFGASEPVELRSLGIDLSNVTAVHIGMWLKTSGRNNVDMSEMCSVQRSSLAKASFQRIQDINQT